MYIARDGRKVQDQQLDPNEEIEVYLFSIEEIKKMLKENKILQALHATCLFYALNKLGYMEY
jgi:hypothetical protein